MFQFSISNELEKKISNAHCVGNFYFDDDIQCQNLLELVEKNSYLNKTFCTFYNDNGEITKLTYEFFFKKVNQTANFLIENNIEVGNCVAIISHNHIDTVVLYFAIWAIGAIAVPINVGEDDKRIEFIVENSESKIIFVRENYFERITNIFHSNKKTICVENNINGNFHSTLKNISDNFENNNKVKLDNDALIIYTSGTTGLPKGVVLTQKNLIVDAKEISLWHKIDESQTMMCILPLHHVNGIVVTLLTPMFSRASVVLNQKFHSNNFFKQVEKENVNIVSVVPTILQFLLNEYENKIAPQINSLRHFICGAGPLTCELANKFEKKFHISIIHGYGLSETTCYSCFLPIDLNETEHIFWMNEFGFPSIGVSIPSNEMAIHNENGNELSEMEKGEIVIRGKNVMKSYFKNSEANEKSFTYNWFRSGDEGFFKLDKNGKKFFFITGRLKELIIRGGTNISPFAIDEILMNIEGVEIGLAVGFENIWYGEEVGAYIKLKENSNLIEKEILSYCRKFISFSLSPKVVVFGNEIPVTSTGKYQRNKLKHLFEKWKEIQFTKK